MARPTAAPMVLAASSCSTRIFFPSAGLEKRATSPAAKMSGSLVRSDSSTSTPSLTARPAATASSVDGAEIDHPFAERQPARRAAGGEEQLAVAVLLAAIVAHAARLAIDLQRAPSREQLHALGKLEPDAFLGFALPERFGKRRTGVRFVLLGGEDADAAARVHLADAARGRCGGHASADDQIREVGHAEEMHIASARFPSWN